MQAAAGRQGVSAKRCFQGCACAPAPLCCQQGSCAIMAQQEDRHIPAQRPTKACYIHLTAVPHSRVAWLLCSMPGYRICLDPSMHLFCGVAAVLKPGQAAHAGRHSNFWWIMQHAKRAPPPGPLLGLLRQRSGHWWQAGCSAAGRAVVPRPPCVLCGAGALIIIVKFVEADPWEAQQSLVRSCSMSSERPPLVPCLIH